MPPRLVGHETPRTEIRIAVVIQLTLLLLVAGNLARASVFQVQGGNKDVPLILNDLLVAGVVALGASAALLHRRLRIDVVALTGLAFAVVGALTAVAGISRFGFSGSEVFVALGFVARWLVYFGLYLVGINAIRARDVLPVWSALERATLLFSAFGLVQAAFLPNFAQIVYPDSGVEWDAQRHRLVSTFLDPNFAGALIFMVLLVELSFLSVGVRVARWKPLLLMAALIVTLSRSSVLGFIVGLGLIIMVHGLSKRILALLGVVAMGVIAALPQFLKFAAGYNKTTLSDESALGRLVAWAHQLIVFGEHPVFGIGLNAWGAISQRRGWLTSGNSSLSIEGGLLFVAALTGIVGLSLFVSMIAVVIVRARRVWRDPSRLPHERGIAIALPAITLAILLHSMFSNSLFYPMLMEPLWILWALGFVIAHEPLELVPERVS
jgi:hypothetical protein